MARTRLLLSGIHSAVAKQYLDIRRNLRRAPETINHLEEQMKKDLMSQLSTVWMMSYERDRQHLSVNDLKERNAKGEEILPEDTIRRNRNEIRKGRFRQLPWKFPPGPQGLYWALGYILKGHYLCH